jgi:hypothetical protein
MEMVINGDLVWTVKLRGMFYDIASSLLRADILVSP